MVIDDCFSKIYASVRQNILWMMTASNVNCKDSSLFVIVEESKYEPSWSASIETFHSIQTPALSWMNVRTSSREMISTVTLSLLLEQSNLIRGDYRGVSWICRNASKLVEITVRVPSRFVTKPDKYNDNYFLYSYRLWKLDERTWD